jgi:hypothetical protein
MPIESIQEGQAMLLAQEVKIGHPLTLEQLLLAHHKRPKVYSGSWDGKSNFIGHPFLG